MTAIYAVLAVIAAFLIVGLIAKAHITGELHIESSPLGSHFYFQIPNDPKIRRRKWIIMNVIHTEVSSEEHEAYVLKEKE